jgi:hypothetical protein
MNMHLYSIWKKRSNKKFLETDYLEARPTSTGRQDIGIFRLPTVRDHFSLKGQTEISYFASPVTAKKQLRPLPRRGKSETPRQSLGEFFSIKGYIQKKQ